MSLTHRAAFEWLQRERDGDRESLLSRALEDHLAACPECQENAALARRLELAGAAAPFPASGMRKTDRQATQEILRLRRRQKLVWEPLQGIAWAALAVLLVLGLSWAIESLRPGTAGGPVSAGSGPAAEALRSWAGRLGQALESARLAPGGDTVGDLDQWLFENFYLAGLIPLLGMALLGIFLGLRQAEVTWLAFLLGMLAFGVAVIYWGMVPQNQNFIPFTLLALPLLVAAVALLAIHLWNTPSLHTRPAALVLLVWTGGIALLAYSPWYGSERMEVFRSSPLIILPALGLILAFIWQAWSWKRWGRWVLPLIFLAGLIGLGFCLLMYFSAGLRFSPWAGVGQLLGYLLWPMTATLLVARLVSAWLSARQPFPRKQLFGGMLGALGLYAGVYILVRALAIDNSVDEDALSGTFLLFIIDCAALAACVALAWEMSRRRTWMAIALVLLFALALIPAAVVPEEMAEQVTVQRAGQIDRAIREYQAENGRYPAALEELTPRYLLLLPGPISHYGRSWCYAGDTDSYQLGYLAPVRFGYPGNLQVKLYASAGEILGQETPCQAELRRLKEKYP